ncbi:MAG: UTP--glucose-1-phosphate uridylyltransferase, partial [Verrucomicrobiota bacterium]
FGLGADRVKFIVQGLMPAVDVEGKIILSGKGEIARSPDGHGGSLRALVRSGAVAWLEEQDIDVISYFQVDNPLVRLIDPAFIGFHIQANSQLSSKALPKAYPEEKVGVFCEQGDRSLVVEYSDLPDALARETNADGELRFRGGSIAIHIFDRDFIQRVGSGENTDFKLPFHLAHKKIPFINTLGEQIKPDQPNGYKFEMFVFDALPFAENPVIIETGRADDFSPVKNPEGIDSAQSSADDQLRQFARWVIAAGVDLETDDSGLPAVRFEVSPLFATDAESFKTRWDGLQHQPELVDGLVLA